MQKAAVLVKILHICRLSPKKNSTGTFKSLHLAEISADPVTLRIVSCEANINKLGFLVTFHSGYFAASGITFVRVAIFVFFLFLLSKGKAKKGAFPLK